MVSNMLSKNTKPENLTAEEDDRERVFVTNMLGAANLFEGEARVKITPITVEAARDFVAGKRPLLFVAQVAYLCPVSQDEVATLMPLQIGEEIWRELDTPVFKAGRELQLPFEPGTADKPFRFLLAEPHPVASTKSKVLIQINKPKIVTQIDWSIVEVTSPESGTESGEEVTQA